MNKFNFLVFIDDDPLTNILHEIIVKESGCCDNFQFFDTPEVALDFFRKLKEDKSSITPDFIFLDINMPRLSGWEFLEEYQRIFANQPSPVVMVTTSQFPGDISRSDEHPLVYKLLEKPLTKTHLLQLNPSFNLS